MICAEFGGYPHDARRALDDDPEQLVITVMRLRAFARTKAQMDAAIKANRPEDMPTGPIAERVRWVKCQIETGAGGKKDT